MQCNATQVLEPADIGVATHCTGLTAAQQTHLVTGPAVQILHTPHALSAKDALQSAQDTDQTDSLEHSRAPAGPVASPQSPVRSNGSLADRKASHCDAAQNLETAAASGHQAAAATLESSFKPASDAQEQRNNDAADSSHRNDAINSTATERDPASIAHANSISGPPWHDTQPVWPESLHAGSTAQMASFEDSASQVRQRISSVCCMIPSSVMTTSGVFRLCLSVQQPRKVNFHKAGVAMHVATLCTSSAHA